MKNSIFFSILCLLSLFGFIVACGNHKDSVSNEENDIVLDSIYSDDFGDLDDFWDLDDLEDYELELEVLQLRNIENAILPLFRKSMTEIRKTTNKIQIEDEYYFSIENLRPMIDNSKTKILGLEDVKYLKSGLKMNESLYPDCYENVIYEYLYIKPEPDEDSYYYEPEHSVIVTELGVIHGQNKDYYIYLWYLDNYESAWGSTQNILVFASLFEGTNLKHTIVFAEESSRADIPLYSEKNVETFLYADFRFKLNRVYTYGESAMGSYGNDEGYEIVDKDFFEGKVEDGRFKVLRHTNETIE